MAITIKFGPDGPQAVCDTTAEALELLKQGSNTNHSTPANGAKSHTPIQNGNHISPSEKARAVLSETSGNSKNLLWFLSQFPDGIEAGELSTASGIQTVAFGGLFGVASKIAASHSLSFDKLVKSEIRFRGKGKDKQRYRWMAPTKLLTENADCVKV